MAGIYIAAIITTALALAVFGSLIHKLRSPANEWLLLGAAVLVLPLQPLVFYWLRIPLDHWLVARLGSTSSSYQWLISLYAPLTEEPAKLFPLLIPAIYRDIRPANFARYAIAIGLGFAIGEMWFVAERIARNPQFVHLPFYQFGGYISERLMTCVFHSAFVSVSLWRLRRRLFLGLAGAMVLHWLGNFPISLMAWNAGKMGHHFWALAVQYWLVIYFLGAAGLLARFAFGRFSPGRFLFGVRRCPECHADYDAPILALNLGPTRYERCPHCRHWHWTKNRNA